MDTIKLNPHHYTDLKGLKLDGTEVTPSAADLNDAGEYIYIHLSTGVPATAPQATVYGPGFRVPCAMELISATVRVETDGVDDDEKVDILKAASATAMSSGTQMVTQITGSTNLADATDFAAVVKTDGSEDLVAGNLVYLKIIGKGSTGELTHPMATLKLQRKF